jgi:beta-lactam-binding protein with PASTA domain/tRNA A-37 threonylcarbamoyl transferase component Bud32
VSYARAADRVGQVLGGRYRLLAPIGTGASATVYLADDVVLRRRVAVKVLHDALADDAAFLRRFEAEARAAAALNHPHIMAVHDWGQGDVPYLVTELLDGGSLRALLDRGARLDPAQARQVGVDAARALDHAHRRGFVHRDIKPANLLFDEEGMVRIADFGLARALAEAAWTEPAGAVLGTAKYASPEQAQGATLDGSSDVYSLGLVLIESVTGAVPFTADTTLGTLMARIGRPVPVPETLGALVPALRAAGAPDPADRPDAAAFATMLMAAGDLGPVTRLPLAGTTALRPDDLDPREPTTVYVPVEPPGGPVFVDPTVSSDPSGSAPLIVQPPTRSVDRGIDGPSAATTGAGDAMSVRRPRRRRRLLLAVLAALVVIGGAGAFALLRTPTHTIGSYVDLPIDEARAALESKGLRVATESQVSETVPVDVVVEQDPPPGTTMSEGSTVTLVVSSGPPPVAVPTDLVGSTVEQATASLARASLRPGELIDTFDENVPKGIVLSLGPGVGATAPKGSAVPLVVSAGARPRTIPEGLVGKPIAEVTAQLDSLGLKVKRIDDWSETVPESVVMVVSPAAGQSVAKGSTVDVTVSKGKRPVTIPAAVVGQPCSAGASTLQGLGLVVNINPFGATVRSVNPAAGSQVRVGSTVTIACG